MNPAIPREHRFEDYYRTIYGERWVGLRTALLMERSPIEFSDGLLQPYYLDEASLIAASLLPIQEGNHVLDMCAAPGGKSLVLAVKLAGTGMLVCNDRSSQRRSRLIKVLDDHLIGEYRSNITVSSHDATRWGLYEQEAYDSILLDAPCSSERHVLADPSALAQWGPARTKHLAIQQFAMLAAALEAVRIGGTILYSTCSISPMENEEVIQKLYKKRSGRFEEIPSDIKQSESLSHGCIILPDISNGMGPLFFCLIRRIS
jgi:5-methylcytosine rRNA methyltransferase NSUN4